MSADAVSDLLKLAERCEAATGANRELDEAIHEAVFRGRVLSGEEKKKQMQQHGIVVSGCLVWRGALTTSLDAAMTLVPEGWSLMQVGTTDDSQAWAELAGDDGHITAQDAATPALALCAAALRARAAGEGQ